MFTVFVLCAQKNFSLKRAILIQTSFGAAKLLVLRFYDKPVTNHKNCREVPLS